MWYEKIIFILVKYQFFSMKFKNRNLKKMSVQSIVSIRAVSTGNLCLVEYFPENSSKLFFPISRHVRVRV